MFRSRAIATTVARRMVSVSRARVKCSSGVTLFERQSRCLASISSLVGSSYPTATASSVLYGESNSPLNFGLSSVQFSSAAAAGDVVEICAQGFPESVSEGTLCGLEKEPGDFCEADEVICQIETDKTAIDVRCPVAGNLQEILVEEDDTVEAGQVLFRVVASDEVPAEPTSSGETKQESTAAEPTEVAPAKAPTPAASKATPAAAPTTPVEPSSSSEGNTSSSGPSRVEYRKKMSRMRLTIARRLKDAQNTAAMLTTFNEVDMTAAMELRKTYKDEFEKRHGSRLGFMSIFSKACAEALMEIPAINARIDDETNEVIYHEYADISVAVASPRGLLVPVMRNVESMSFLDIERTIASLGEKARNDEIAMEDMAGGTFTISNGGVFGSMMGTPILNPPQSAILGMHAIKQRPMVIDGEIKARPMMYLALTYDHRLVDGREAVTFLCSIRDKVEDPRRLLLSL